MKSLNRTLSLVLVLVMVLGLFGVAGASDFKDQADIKNAEAVNTMAALNIINGKDGNIFDPAAGVTRAEMAKMICVALNGGKDPIFGTTVNPSYTDTKGHWAAGYIEYCTALGIVAGMGDGTFAPDAPVTGSQAAKMLLVAMNYDADIFGFTGATWENKVNTEANKAGLYESLAGLDASAPISRDNAAQLTYNAIMAKTMFKEWKSDGTITYSATGPSIAADKFSLYTGYITINEVTYDTVDKEYDVEIENDATVENDDKDSLKTELERGFATDDDYSEYYMMRSKILFRETSSGDVDVYGIYPYKSSVVLAGVVGQLSDSNIGTQLLADADSIRFNGTTYKFDARLVATAVYDFNTAATTTLGAFFSSAAEPDTAKGGRPEMAAYNFKAIDNTGNGKIDCIVVYPFEVYEVTYVGTDTASITAAAAFSAATGTEIDLEEDVVYDGIAENDWVKKTPAANTVADADTYEKITAMSGEVTKTVTEDRFPKATINGIKFVDLTGLPMAVGTSYNNIIQVNTFMFSAKVGEGTASASKYAVVIGTADTYGDYTAKLLFADGTISTVETATDYTGSFANDADKLVTYTKGSNGKYTLKDADHTVGGYKDKVTDPELDTTNDRVRNQNDHKEVYGIADNAVVFVKDNDKSYRIITGAQFAKLSNATVNDAFFTQNSSTKFENVQLAFITLPANVTVGDTEYGYMLKEPVTIADGRQEVTYWDGAKEVTATASGVDKEIVKGSVFKYSLDNDGYMRISQILNLLAGEVEKYDSSTGAITITNGTGDEVDADDTTVMYIDSDEVKGVAGGRIGIAKPGTNNVYFINGDSDTDPFKFIVYDVKNDIPSLTRVTAPDTTITDTAYLQSMLDSYDEVTVTGDHTLDAPLTVPTGKKLTITGDLVDSADKGTTLGAADVANRIPAGKLIVDGKIDTGTAAMAVTSIGDIENSDFTAAGVVTIHGTQSITDAILAANADKIKLAKTATLTVTDAAAADDIAKITGDAGAKIVTDLQSKSAFTGASKFYTTATALNTANLPAGTYTYYAENTIPAAAGGPATHAAGWFTADAVALVGA